MPREAIHCFDLGTVRFAIYPHGLDGPRILADISEDALRDVFGADGGPESLVRTCEAHFERIEEIALDVHERRPAWPVQIEIADCQGFSGKGLLRGPAVALAARGCPA